MVIKAAVAVPGKAALDADLVVRPADRVANSAAPVVPEALAVVPKVVVPVDADLVDLKAEDRAVPVVPRA